VDLTAELAGYAADHDRTGDFPVKGIQAVHDAGLLTSTVGTAFGGSGAGVTDTVRTLAALGQGDPAVALITAMTLFAHAAQARTQAWPSDVYAEVLAESAERPTLINALRVEPELGTPARGGLPATTARRTATGWSLTGHKIFSTGAVALRWMQVWAKTDEDPVRVGAFLVRADSPGITVDRTWNHLGLRASRSDDVTFDQVRVPAGHLIATDPAGLRDLNALGIAAIYLGVARAARDWLTGYLRERTPANLGAPLASLPRFQVEVGALTRDHPLERHLRDVLCGRIHTPQDDAVLGATGRAALEGAPA
jgi:alkylation response protein AidB-like acyl-CoA dehydrogenase